MEKWYKWHQNISCWTYIDGLLSSIVYLLSPPWIIIIVNEVSTFVI